MKQMEYGEGQHHHLRVLQLHERVAVPLVCSLLDPERRIDDRRLRILSQLRLVPDGRAFAAEKLNILDASAKLRNLDVHRRTCGAGVGFLGN